MSLAWRFVHDFPAFRESLHRYTHTLWRPQWTKHWKECKQFYADLDVKGRRVLDLGSDIGVSPMYFLKRGARTVTGITLDKQHFSNTMYRHLQVSAPLDETDFRFVKSISGFYGCEVLKADIEGWEWNMTSDFISKFDDWVIALHHPIENEALYEWIKEHGILLGGLPGTEFAVYRRRA